jgi:hypothetical protein
MPVPPSAGLELPAGLMSFAASFGPDRTSPRDGWAAGGVERPLGLCLAAYGSATLLLALIRPLAQRFPVPPMRSALLSIRVRTQLLVLQSPDLDHTRPAAPATCGVAMLVPLHDW